jgi:hypothetical protein
MFGSLHCLAHAQFTKLPHVGLHTNAIVLVFSKVRQPKLDGFSVAILDLDQSSQCHTLKVLLRFLEDEVTPRDCPPFRDSRQGHRAISWQTQVIRGSEGKVREKLEWLEAEGPYL